MNERIAMMRERSMINLPRPDPRAEELRKESSALTAGEPPVIREAKAIAHFYRNRTLVIHDGELVVGDNPRLQADNVKMGIFGRQSWTGGNLVSVPDHVETFFKEGILSWAGNHKTLDYETIFEIGFLGLCRQIDDRLARLAEDEPDYEEKSNFLQALKIIAAKHHPEHA